MSHSAFADSGRFEVLAEEAGLARARVALQDGERYSLILDGGGERIARRAASCLLAPRPGDHVLVALGPEPFVIAVLEQGAARRAELVFDGDAAIVSRSGRLELDAPEGIRMSSRQAVEVVSRIASVVSSKAEFVFGEVGAVATRARANFEEAAFVVNALDMFSERVTQRAERIYRFVSQFEQLRARHFDYRAEKSAQVRGENAVILARQVARMDGEQVHIG